MNESFHCFTHEIGDFEQWTTYKVCNVWLLTLTSIYIWVVRDICVERVWVANSSAIFFYNAIIVPLTTCIRHYIGTHLQKQSFWNCEPLCLTAHKICIPNLSGNLGNVYEFVIFFRPFFFLYFMLLTVTTKIFSSLNCHQIQNIIQYGNWWKWHYHFINTFI